MGHCSSIRKERKKKAETFRSRSRAPLNLFVEGGVLARKAEEDEVETPEKKGEEGWGRLSGWWRGCSRLKAYGGESNSNDVNSKENMEKEEKEKGKEGAGEKKCVAFPSRNVNEDYVTTPRSIFGGNKSQARSKEHGSPIAPRKSIFRVRSRFSHEEKKAEYRKAVSFSKEVSVVLIPHNTEISAEDKEILWWNGADSKGFQKRLVALLPVGTDLTKSLLVLGKMCMDLVQMEDPFQSDTHDNSKLGSPKSFEEQNTMSFTWGGEEKTHKFLPDIPQQQCSSPPPEVCSAAISTNGDVMEGNWGGHTLTLVTHQQFRLPFPSTALGDDEIQSANCFQFQEKTRLSEFSGCY